MKSGADHFAGLEPTEDAALKFANEWGILGSESLPHPALENLAVPGDRFSVWSENIQRMQWAVHLWDAARTRIRRKLLGTIHWQGNRVFYDDGNRTALVASPEYKPERLQPMIWGDLLTPAWHLIHDAINESVQECAAPRMMWAKRKLALHLVPHHLLGALWLQFAYDVARNPKLRQCENCRKWFEYQRSTRKVCSAACKQAQLRKRQRGKSHE